MGSLLGMVFRLFDSGEAAAAVYLAMGVCAIPMVDLAAASLRLRGHGAIAQIAHHPAARALTEFSLLDVSLASLLVTRLATGGMSTGIVVSVAPEGLMWLA